MDMARELSSDSYLQEERLESFEVPAMAACASSEYSEDLAPME